MDRPLKRVLLKLSGEAFAAENGQGIDSSSCEKIAKAIRAIHEEGLEIAIVIGAGNLFRGGKRTSEVCGRIAADQIGLLATMMNGIALREALSHMGVRASHASAIECPKLVETYKPQKAQEALSQGTVMVFSGGIGNPFFTTDTAAALRAKELRVDLLLKATTVSGVFNKDPAVYSDAKLYKTISFTDALKENLNVMDMTAFALCRSENMPIFVFDLNLLFTTSIRDIVSKQEGTLVSSL